MSPISSTIHSSNTAIPLEEKPSPKKDPSAEESKTSSEKAQKIFQGIYARATTQHDPASICYHLAGQATLMMQNRETNAFYFMTSRNVFNPSTEEYIASYAGMLVPFRKSDLVIPYPQCDIALIPLAVATLPSAFHVCEH